MREHNQFKTAAEFVQYVHIQLRSRLRPGVHASSLEEFTQTLLDDHGAIGYFKGWGGYPALLSIPIGREIVHAPPVSQVLKTGDLVTIEFGATYRGEHAFLASTEIIGPSLGHPANPLLEAAYEALREGTSLVADGVAVASVSKRMDSVIREAGFFPNRYYVGYRMGEDPVMPPQIPCRFDNKKPPEGEFREGMVLSLLAIVQQTDADNLVEPDGWTVVTADGSDAVMVSQLIKVGSADAGVIASGIPD